MMIVGELLGVVAIIYVGYRLWKSEQKEKE